MSRKEFLKLGLVFLLCLFYYSSIQGQVNAPDLYCVKGDTLRWRLPVNPCGPMTAYEIYSATQAGGPYTLLATITDLSQTEYIRQSSPGGTLYYYMRTLAGCVDNMLSSDTLDNASPEPVEVISASVNGDDIFLTWTASPSPEVVNYIIFREDPNGQVIRLDTLSTLSYIDYNVSTDSLSYAYYITAVDECWVSSVFPDKHRTMVLKYTLDTCRFSASLQSNPYLGFSNPGYELWYTKDNGTEQLMTTAVTSSFTVDLLDPQHLYSFRIKAISSTGVYSWSNLVYFSTYTSPRLRSICITDLGPRINVADSSDIVVISRGAASPAFIDLVISGNYYQALAAVQGNKMLSIANDQGQIGTTLNTPLFYKIIAHDNCGSPIHSNTVQNITLSGILANARKINLSWNTVHWENANLTSYELYYLPENAPEELIFTTLTDTSFIFDIPAAISATSFCFRIVANLDLYCDSLNAVPAHAFGDIVCIEKTAGFYPPNAFKRNGLTPEFKPVIYFIENIQSYQMVIYDRWGSRIFSTNDPLKGWDGKLGGREAPGGIYVWQISLRSNGQTQEQKGTLMLVE